MLPLSDEENLWESRVSARLRPHRLWKRWGDDGASRNGCREHGLSFLIKVIALVEDEGQRRGTDGGGKSASEERAFDTTVY